MSLAGILMLSPDVHLIPVAVAPASVRELVDGETEGYVLTRQHARTTSSLIDDGLAQLLKEFEQPATVVEAIMRYSRRRSIDPEHVLDDAFETLRRCVEQGYLVASGSSQARSHENVFTPGQPVADGTILRCVQALEDTEVYQVANSDGTLLALKVLRPESSDTSAEAFDREALALRELKGRIAPRLFDTGTTGDSRWLALEWCDGTRVTEFAAALTATSDGDARLLDLSIRVLNAYSDLHAQGLIHGDVHPGNILVAEDGKIRLVDFGLARRPDGSVLDHAARGGAPGYIAPDHAAAMLEGRAPGPATQLTEIFSLGALLYELFTGAPYLDFSMENGRVLLQVIADPPLPFIRRGRTPWPAVEHVLKAALAKSDTGRPTSVADLRAGLVRARGKSALPEQRILAAAGVDAMLEAILEKSRPDGDWFERDLPTAPLCSIAYGTAGLAVALHHVAVLRDDGDLLALSDEWALRARRAAGHPDAFRHAGLEISDDVTGKVSPFHRLSGVHAAQALVSFSFADDGAGQRAVDAFVRESLHDGANFDLALGRTGTLLAAAILVEASGHPARRDLNGLRELGNQTLSDLWAWIDSMPSVATAKQLHLLGVAHGWSGAMLASLRWCSATSTPLPTSLLDRLDQVAAIARREGNALSWPWSTSTTSVSRGWCNGTAGLVHLWTAAHRAFGDDRWLSLAKGAAWHASVVDDVTPQLCCGLAGQAYAQLEMYRSTGESHWLTLACKLAEAAATRHRATAGNTCILGSLHKGDLGIAVLAADLQRPEDATMPFFGPAI
jgi:serine/threonine-protein kinase